MSRLPTRWRLTLVFALAMAVVLLLASLFVYQRVGAQLSRSIDTELRSRAQDLSALVLQDGSLRGAETPLVERGETFAELLGADGRVVDASSSLGSARLLDARELARAKNGPLWIDRSSAPGLNEPARLLAIPLERNGRTAVLVAGTTRENRAEVLRGLRTAFLIGGPLALLLASLAGYLLAGAALRPIETMRRRAEQISDSSLHERLPVPAVDDEVARLGRTLNEMLARIEAGLAREREFVADASHELRTPLALLKTELELALRRPRDREALEESIRSATDEVVRLEHLADDLLLLAGSEDGDLPLRLEPVDVADLLQTVAARFEGRAATAGRALRTEPDGASVLVGDRLRLEQAVGNLVDNALRHGGGDVTLSAGRGRDFELHVLDEGAGFPPEFLDRAFERFSRADEARSARGSGLGLAIVETIARAHEGSAGAANRPEGGADVWIALPGA